LDETIQQAFFGGVDSFFAGAGAAAGAGVGSDFFRSSLQVVKPAPEDDSDLAGSGFGLSGAGCFCIG